MGMDYDNMQFAWSVMIRTIQSREEVPRTRLYGIQIHRSMINVVTDYTIFMQQVIPGSVAKCLVTLNLGKVKSLVALAVRGVLQSWRERVLERWRERCRMILMWLFNKLL